MNKKNLLLSVALSGSMLLSTGMPGLSAQEATYAPGVTVEKNTNPDWDADYVATFVYEDKDEKDAVAVNVQGGFQYYWENDVKDYDASGDNSNIPCYDAFNYKKGMFAASSSLQTGDMIPYTMEEISDEVFKLTLPVPANQYFYAYNVEYAGVKEVKKICDPANLPEKNGDSDAGWSLFYVGNGETQGQEYIYPSTNKKGSVEYVEYTAIDGTKQPLGVYLPYNYDETKTYKTIYVSHGGGGNEVEWMTIGSIPNIMDNLLANKQIGDAIVVTMDNSYFGWNYANVVPNVTDYIKPFIESHYSVSKDAQDRAFCGLSMGSMTTNEMLKQVPEEFGYYGAFSGGNPDLISTNWNSEAMNKATIYLTAGCIDMAYNNSMGISSVDYMKLLDSINVDYTFDLKLGAHDWYVWRDSFTTFAKDYLWDYEYSGESAYKAGVTVEENKNVVYDGDYAATFVYEDQDEKNAVNVTVSGNLQFYAKDDEAVKNYTKTLDLSNAKAYNAYEYKDGMFNTGYGLNNDMAVYELKETKDERFEITLPLPGNLYYYDYTVTYDDGSTVTIQDPVNPSPKNTENGHDAGHSLVYVGNADNTTEGQEYIYERTDYQKGSYSFVNYDAVDGTKQPLGVYLPHNYDATKTYKTIYVSHGGGGNENEWMTIGAIPNIMDNLVADKEVAEAIVVTMDNTYFNWDYDQIKNNLMNHIIPYVESHYSVSNAANDRAFCGLSMGGLTTTSIYTTLADKFGYLGIWSATDPKTDVKAIKNADKPVLLLAAGIVDFGKSGFTGTSDYAGLLANLDDAGIKYDYIEPYGAHDWGVWRSLFTTFAKDYLWDVESEGKIDPIVTPDTPSKPVVSVKTGDSINVVPYLCGMLLGAVYLSQTALKKRK